MRKVRHRWFGRSLLNDQRGLALVEMSLILSVLVLLICGSVDMAMCFARQLSVQQAAARTMEFAIAKGMQSTLASNIASDGASGAGVADANISVTSTSTSVATVSYGSIGVTSKVWLECGGTEQVGVDPYTGTCTTGNPARYASVTITDTYNWMFEAIVNSWNHSPFSIALKGYAEVRLQ